MTSTWIAGGTDTFESLLRGAEGGLYIPDFFHGSGMSTFTIAPARAYRIRGGKPAEPVLVSVISGNVMQTLHQIDGATAETELHSLFTGRLRQNGAVAAARCVRRAVSAGCAA